MLESQPKTKFSQDRFISAKPKLPFPVHSEYMQPEKMDAEEKTPYEMLISGEIFHNEMVEEALE